MALLTDYKSINKLILKPLYYSEKDEHWFSVEVQISNIDERTKGIASFHINDFCLLISDIQSLINDAQSSHFEPIESYINIRFSKDDDQYIADIFFCKGPVFEPSKYKNIKIKTTKEALVKFMEEVKIELRNIDPNLELKSVDL